MFAEPPILRGILLIFLQGFGSCLQELIFLTALMSGAGRREAGPFAMQAATPHSELCKQNHVLPSRLY